MASTKAYRGKILDFLDDPSAKPVLEENYRYYEDGALVVTDGIVEWMGPYSELQNNISSNVRVINYGDKLIMPGFIDTHIHYPQTEMIGAYGEQLLQWLNTYTFPAERQFEDPAHASKWSEIFVDELLRNGTTSALVFGTVHPQSVDALFESANKYSMRMIAGKVMMDRNAPDYLLDTPETSYQESKQLIEKWHGKDRLLYAVTPRFAPTSSPEQLTAAGKLLAEYPSVYMHTHLSENKGEIEWVKFLFPENSGYLDVYDSFNLTGPRSIFAHSIHLSDDEWSVMSETQSTIAFCPTSNLFLGSGLFKLDTAKENNVRVGMGTDVGAGTSFSMFETLNEAYKIMQLQGSKFSALEGFYLATLGGAKSLSLDDKIGNFEVGKEADFIVIDAKATNIQKLRNENSKNYLEQLFVLMMLGDDRNIYATYVDGRRVYSRKHANFKQGLKNFVNR
ncbi:MAG: guanine deaminase [Pseudomonadales bacterium]|nr:guanine deaminase [Pseudomonadales bacterium]